MYGSDLVVALLQMSEFPCYAPLASSGVEWRSESAFVGGSHVISYLSSESPQLQCFISAPGQWQFYNSPPLALRFQNSYLLA
jgi:hypothetical protein